MVFSGRPGIVIASESNPPPPVGFACGEVRGRNGTIHTQVALPGLRGVLYSRPCAGATGGDIHYLSAWSGGDSPAAKVLPAAHSG
jgi:hypothetical protein